MSARCLAERLARCPTCNAWIDPDCCWCGDTPEGWDHRSMDGHPFVPNGCVCMMHGHRGYCDPREQRCETGESGL